MTLQQAKLGAGDGPKRVLTESVPASVGARVLEGEDGWIYCTECGHHKDGMPVWCHHLEKAVVNRHDCPTDQTFGISYLPDRVAVPIVPSLGSWATVGLSPISSVDGSRYAEWIYGQDPVTREELGFLYLNEGRRDLRVLIFERLRSAYSSRSVWCTSSIHHTYRWSKAYKPVPNPTPGDFAEIHSLIETGWCTSCSGEARLDAPDLIPEV